MHAGFLAQYEALRAHLHPYILGRHGDLHDIVVAGHSLGSALATMFAIDVVRSLPQAHVPCYAFACPRVGDAAFV